MARASTWRTTDRAAAAPGDLVITADIPLAAEVIARGAHALDPRGELYSEDNVHERLAVRNLMQELRATGESSAGPAPFGAQRPPALRESARPFPDAKSAVVVSPLAKLFSGSSVADCVEGGVRAWEGPWNHEAGGRLGPAVAGLHLGRGARG